MISNVEHPAFRADVQLMAVDCPEYDVDQAADLVRVRLLERM